MKPIREYREKTPPAWWRTPAWVALVMAVALSTPRIAQAQRPPQRRPGKVLLIRGAFTIFSLGLDTLGDKLKEYGPLNVEVVPAYSASAATERIRDEYIRRPMPIVIIGHSKGGYLAPDCAEELGKKRIPVRLVVIVDNPHEVTVPANVQRCVNFYQTNYLGVVVGALAHAENQHTQLLNLDVDELPHRDEGGYIDHFNIHSSPWLHSKIIGEVLNACPAEGAARANSPRVSNRGPTNGSLPNGTAPRGTSPPNDDAPRVMYRDRLNFPSGQLKVRR